MASRFMHLKFNQSLPDGRRDLRISDEPPKPPRCLSHFRYGGLTPLFLSTSSPMTGRWLLRLPLRTPLVDGIRKHLEDYDKGMADLNNEISELTDALEDTNFGKLSSTFEDRQRLENLQNRKLNLGKERQETDKLLEALLLFRARLSEERESVDDQITPQKREGEEEKVMHESASKADGEGNGIKSGRTPKRPRGVGEITR
ncbi:hypothetical protein BDV96DRAFT_606208 [Lophiotrema nucula]|uniref:Uncharacterized protein n=1 Tax=Lophiotrema nucula TaxID=690887 RepID=A0A6A5YLG7_9PLEO|nr:hypothetical protein BDV96DRAFT_606208 [Lophiotrema nucula]